MATLPPVKLEIHISWFNELMELLHQTAEQSPWDEYREMAKKLVSKFIAYGKPFVDNEGKRCVELRMYPKEAEDTIWLLLLELCWHCEPQKDYSAELKNQEGV